MTSSIVIDGLVEKRAKLAGEIAEHERLAHQLRIDLSHLDATLRLFDSSLVLQAIPARRVARGRVSLFENGEIARRCRESLRDAKGEPLAAEAIVRWAMADKRMDLDDKPLRQDLICRFLIALDRLRRKGEARKIGHGIGSRWTVLEG